ncbi:MAG: molybdopterin biosynthesis protein, partial [Clostridia bacterium]|nr:molybdopterin biosynthesis protein [Clostridia bacterium]
SSPYYNASAMDGVCVRYERTVEANEKKPLRLKKDVDYKIVDTGDAIDAPYNAVIMIEDIREFNSETIEIFAACSAWQHVRSVGEDIVKGEMIVPSYHKVKPVDIGALYAGGISQIEVIKKPIVTIIPTGTELVESPKDIAHGKIIDSNSRMFEAMAADAGAACKRLKPVIDDFDLIKKTVADACEDSDIVIIGAGSSAGTEDYTRQGIEELGEVLFHGVSIKPGKPVVLGKVNGTCVVGTPGYPVSAYFVFEYFVRSAINQYLCQADTQRESAAATLANRVVSSLKHLEFVRVKLGSVGGKMVAAPLKRGAGVTMSLVNADGVLKIPKNVEGYEAGQEVRVELMKDIGEIERSIVSIGSHDIMLDMLNDLLHKGEGNMNLSSTHVGSMGGIAAMSGGNCHFAPVHLLDETTGLYNAAHIKKYLKDTDCVLVKGVRRTQGIMVHKNSEKKIERIADLAQDGMVFANRQKGSGTRILVDYQLNENGVDASDIEGYERVVGTHMMVAMAVASGSADAGVGVMSAARAMELDFYPIGEEDYDFVVRKDFLDTEKFAAFMDALKSDELRQALDGFGGYKYPRIGEVVQV